MIIFLDIDGVLHTEPATAEQAFSQRHLLWEFLMQMPPTASVVISSNWRLRYSLDELVDFILAGCGNPSLRERFVGVTPFLPAMQYEYRGREAECLAWLKNAGREGEPWIAIDDVHGNFDRSSNVVIVDYKTGLTENDVSRILALVLESCCGRRC